MSHYLFLFALLYGLSCIPPILASLSDSKEAKRGFALMDATLTVLAYVYLWQAVGGWWVAFAVALNIALGKVLKGLGYNPYDV